MASLAEARAAKEKVGELLGDHPDVRGVGIARADGSFGLKVNVSSARSITLVPVDVDGVPVLVEVVGDVRSLPDGPTKDADDAGAE